MLYKGKDDKYECNNLNCVNLLSMVVGRVILERFKNKTDDEICEL